MADKFVELIFEPDTRDTTKYKLAYRSLARNSQQLFALFLQKDVSTEFFSAFEVYGQRLATLLSNIPKYFGLKSGNLRLRSAKDQLNLRLFEEMLGAFLFSLLPLAPSDIASQETMAEIVMAVIKVPRPGGVLELIGTELGERPVILRKLIAGGYIGTWSKEQPASFKSLTSTCSTTWATVAGHLADECPGTFHPEEVGWIDDWISMKKLVESIPCRECPFTTSRSTDETPRANPRAFNINTGAFDKLLGDRLGEWKIILSTLALKNFRGAAAKGHFESIKERLLALASGELVDDPIRQPAFSSTQYRVPVYKVSCGQNVILWQEVIAFDEMYHYETAVIKVWAICPNSQIETMCKWIVRAQKIHTDTRIDTCETDIESSPLLGKFYSLTSTVLFGIEHLKSAVFPVDPSAEEIHIINHVKSPAFILGRSGTGKTTCLIYKLASRYLATKIEDEVPVRQLLLTRSTGLAQKLKLYTKRLINTRLGVVEEDLPSGAEDRINYSDDFEEDSNRDILSLKDADFPLACTFNHFLKLLDNSIKLHQFKNAQYWQGRRVLNKGPPPVNDITFRLEYWRRFWGVLTRNIQVDMAYLDIMGVIKGSASLETNLEPLSREAYISKRWKLAPNFTRERDRSTVYSLYESYEKKKKKRGEFDDIDRVIRIFKSLRESPELQRDVEGVLHEIYVDAGDTAQSISKDSLFRGILSVASVVMDLLYAGMKIHNSPLLSSNSLALQDFRNWWTSYRRKWEIRLVQIQLFIVIPTFALSQIIAKSPAVGSRFVSALKAPQKASSDEDFEISSFGGERVILVRDDTQHDLQEKVGDSALVLTILQSKGMEFEDVFLYNFFSTSPCVSDFRVLVKLLEQYHSSDSVHDQTTNLQDINITMCSELKHLYVAVTRAKARLWIIENETDVVLPIINLFNNVVPKLLPSQYPKALLRVVQDHDFADAAFCFRQDGDTVGEMLANAYLAELSALEYRAVNSRAGFEAAYTKACDLFVQAGRILKAAECQEAMGNTIAAADILSNNGKHEEAAWLYTKAEEPEKAIQEYREVGNHVKVLATCYHAGLYDQLIDYLGDFSSKINRNCREQYARLWYLKMGERGSPQLQMKIRPFLGSVGRQQRAFREFGMPYRTFELYRTDCNIQDVCKVAVDIGFLEYALPLIENRVTLQDSVLSSVLSHVEAKNLLTTKGQFPLKTENRKLVPLQQQWKSLATAVEAYKREGILPDRCFIHEGILYDYFDLLITKTAPDSVLSANLTQVPLEFIERAITILHNTITRKLPPPGALLYLGIFLTPHGQYIALPWSLPGIEPKLDFPIQYMVANTIHVKGSQLILDVISEALTFVHENCKNLWQRGVFRGHGKGWTSDKFSESLQTLVSINRVFSNLDTELSSLARRNEPVISQWKFWKIALIRQMDFVSSYEQDTSVLVEVKMELASTTPELQKLYFQLQDLLLSEMKKELASMIPEVWEEYYQLKDMLLIEAEKKTHRLQKLFSRLQDLLLSEAEKKLEPTKPRLKKLYSLLQNSLLSQVKKELGSTKPELWRLSRLQNFISSRLQDLLFSAPQCTKFGFLSLLLRQMQMAEFLDHDDQWNREMQHIASETSNDNFKEAYEVAILAKAVRSTATPVLFIENVHKLLLKLKKLLDSSGPGQLFYSASLLSFYEEFVTLLLLLIFPHRLAVPRSWAALHLPKFTNVRGRNESPEMAWYQRFLVQIVSSLCQLVIHIKDGKSPADEGLAHRSVIVIAVSMVNMRTLDPLPPGERSLWKEVQKVFSWKKPFTNVTAADLPQRLIKSFDFVEGKDAMKLVVTKGYSGPDKFAGLPVRLWSMIALNRPASYKPTPMEMQAIAAFMYTFTLLSPPVSEQIRSECEVLKEKHQALIRLKEQQLKEQQLKEEQLKEQQLMHQQLREQWLKESRVCRNCCIMAVKDDYFRGFTY
ncbi:hypothetical protein K440DRAFT_665246 [Wilcoxina mikolae CBS 423.85]|nr:hypothetical protein K440DRAFT_665246 [Wilcoxina mikolae CBS 423.85]